MQGRNEAGNPLDSSELHPMSRSWHPYKQHDAAAVAGGAIIYYHENVCHDAAYLGGELMVSIIIQGTPDQAIAALTHGCSTSILGPAAAVSVLSSDQQSQVLHIQLLPPVGKGWAGALCATRHAVVRQTLSTDGDGIQCLLFSSLPAQQAHKLLLHQQRHHRHHHHHHHHHRHASCSSSSSSLWPGGVLVEVSGGVTVAALPGFGSPDTETQETHMCQILKVDFGGWLSEAAWTQRLAPVQALTEAWQEQLLTAVLLAKDAVESQQFRAYPEQQQGLSLPACCDASSRIRRSCSHHCNGGSSQHSSPPSQGLLRGLLQLLRPWSMGFRALMAGFAGRPPTGSAGATRGASQGSGSFSAAAVGPVDAAATEVQQLVGRASNGQPLRGWCNPLFWLELHQPGAPALFKVRGAHYLTDKAKVAAGATAYRLVAVDLVTTPEAVQHLARFLPSVRRARAASCFVVNMMVPSVGSVLNLVMVFASSSSWKQLVKNGDGSSGSSSRCSGSSSRCSSTSSINTTASNSSSAAKVKPEGSWTSLDHALYRFIHGSDQERNSMFKLIPHLEVGSWVLKQMIGTTPVIIGRKLATTYHLTDRYIEVDLDVTTCKTAGYIVNSIRGVTTSLVIDLCYLLEGQRPAELPEVLLGAVRFSGLDMAATRALDISREVPCWPEPWCDE